MRQCIKLGEDGEKQTCENG